MKILFKNKNIKIDIFISKRLKQDFNKSEETRGRKEAKKQGPFNAAAKLNIGQCTVHRHIKNGKSITILYNNDRIPIIFTYS